MSLARLAEDATGALVYLFNRPWSAGTTGITLSPLEILEPLSALVPLPRLHLVCSAGCLAPHSRLREAILRTPRQQGVDGEEAKTGPPAWSWARLLGRVFDVALARCPVCRRGALRLSAALPQELVLTRILRQLKLAPVYGALYHRNAARVDGRLLNHALRQVAVQRGLTIQPGGVERFVLQQHAVTGVVVAGEMLTAGKVIIAGSAWSQAFGTQLGITIPVAPQRGQIIHLGLPGTDTTTWPMLSAFHGHYMVAWPDSHVVVGATRETGSGFHPYTTVAGVQEVLTEALRVTPGLAQAEIREIRVGLRPLTTDTMPVLGPVPGVENVLLATGHGPTGLTLGPYSGKVIADIALDQPSATDISAFHVARFMAGTQVRGAEEEVNDHHVREGLQRGAIHGNTSPTSS